MGAHLSKKCLQGQALVLDKKTQFIPKVFSLIEVSLIEGHRGSSTPNSLKLMGLALCARKCLKPAVVDFITPQAHTAHGNLLQTLGTKWEMHVN